MTNARPALDRYRNARLVIVGGPRTGKTTYAGTLGLPTKHTDSLIPLGWSEASAEAARWMREPGPWCIEGVATARALRKALAAPHAAPCDLVVCMWRPVVSRSAGQEAMAAGVATVWREVEGELLARGVRVDVL